MEHDYYFKQIYSLTHNTFTSIDDLVGVVGLRPSPQWTLTRTTRFSREPLSSDNFLWITKASIDQAKKGILAPPQFPWTADPDCRRTKDEQELNDARFALHVKGILQWAEARQAREAHREKLTRDYTMLLAHITDYVVSKGYSELDAMNPFVLSDNAKLQAAREKAQSLMVELTSKKKRGVSALVKAQREQAKQVTAHNRIHTNKRGRPVERWIQARIRIADLTPQQRQQYALENPTHPPILPGQDHIYLPNPAAGRPTKRSTVMVTIPNPKALEIEQSLANVDIPPKIRDTAPPSMDTHIDNV